MHATPNGIARNFDGSILPAYDAAHSSTWLALRAFAMHGVDINAMHADAIMYDIEHDIYAEALTIDIERETAKARREARIARKRIRNDKEARAEYQEAKAREEFDRLPLSVQVYELDRKAREARIALRAARNANANEYADTMREAF
jgi:hypothetical protein